MALTVRHIPSNNCHTYGQSNCQTNSVILGFFFFKVRFRLSEQSCQTIFFYG